MDTRLYEPELTRDEFEIFLLIYASHVDYAFTEDEKEFILRRTDQNTFIRMYDLFTSYGDFASLRLILHYKDLYFSDELEQQRLFELLKEAFNSDGDFSRVEKVFISFFKRMKKI